MARVPRRRRSMAKHRRSREERRRLSEGGGGSAPHPPPAADESVPGVVAQDEMHNLTDKEVQKAYQNVFRFDEEYEEILDVQSYCQCEIERLLANKSTVDDLISKLKLTNKSPDSDNIKVIRSLTRKSIELQEELDATKIQLSEIHLTKTDVEACFRSSVSIVDHHVTNEDEEESMVLGFLAYILMTE